ncbi:ATP-binding protein [Streptomyces sp. KMM 9044]|uniref:ATP-binding protein n=1 Tax=Streptomyces sp. KMM 9044 TaxID=2744474 RepID=UPI0021514E29|nr:ATP-binding protein [Streptomyces sp. KMM 9044]WAX78425.1 ATP-binding protein [Streptomyces sp. KMM 9044]
MHDTVELVVAELAADAVTHGRIPGRDAELRLSRNTEGARVRVEVSDARGERLPVPAPDGEPLAGGGRGLALVSALVEEWGVAERPGTAVRAPAGRGPATPRAPGPTRHAASPRRRRHGARPTTSRCGTRAGANRSTGGA